MAHPDHSSKVSASVKSDTGEDHSLSDRERLDATYRECARELWLRFYAFCSDADRAADAVQEAFTRLAAQLDLAAEAGLTSDHSGNHQELDASQQDRSTVQQQGNNTPSSEPIRDFRAWLIRVGRNWLRDVARRKEQANRQVERIDLYPDDPNDAPQKLIRTERQILIEESMDQLSEDDRLVLMMRYSLNWSSQRIANSLDSSPSAIDMRLSRARRRLGDILTEAGLNNDTF